MTCFRVRAPRRLRAGRSAVFAGATLVVLLAPFLAPALIAVAAAQGPTVDGPLPAPLPLLPKDNWWNADVSKAPRDPNSARFITFIGATRRLHPDLGGSANDPTDPQQIYGLPYVVVPGTQKLVPVTFRYAGESDAGAPGRPAGYPIPEQVKTQPGWMEGGAPAGSTSTNDSNRGDRHLLLVDRDNKILYELFALKWNAAANRWEAGSGAVWPLTTNRRRPDGWTSADAAGLAILPGLIRYDEASGTAPIKHAFRVTVRATNGYVFPASHRAGSTTGALPLGARLRLKASVDISKHPAHVQRILQAMKTYGLIVADNGSDMFITGTSDPRWAAQQSSLNTAFRALNAGMFEVVKLGWKPSATAATEAEPTAGPELTDAAAGEVGEEVASATINPASVEEDTAIGGGTVDADDSRQGSAAGADALPAPAAYRRYFAEGVSNEFFTTRFAAVNPGTTVAHVQFHFLRVDATIVSHAVEIPARSRITLDPATIEGLARADYSTVVDSDVEVVLDRTVSWDSRGYGSHAEGSIPEPSTRWLLAEGSTTGDFSLFYLLQNPNATPTTATVRYLRAIGTPIEKTYTLPPNSRTTIDVQNEDAALADMDIAADITALDPIIVERAMYRTRPESNGQPALPFAAGLASAGVTQPATTWFLAEGSTGSFFDEFILLANPSDTDAEVAATYLLPDGTTLSKTYAVGAAARRTIYVDAEEFDGQGPALASAPVSVMLKSANDVPIVAERSMWWPDGAWQEAHHAVGSTEAGTRWGFADGALDEATGTQTFVLIANTSAQAGDVTVTLLYEDGGEESRTYTLPANSRTTVPVAIDFPNAAGRRFGAIVESAGETPLQLVVERAMYANADGVTWASGTDATATRLSAAETPPASPPQP